MPTYLVMIHGVEQVWDAMTPDEARLSAAGHDAFRRAAGDRLGGHEVDRAAGVLSVQAGPDGRRQQTEGPLDLGARVLGGYYLVQAADRQEVADLAGHLRETAVAHSGVEIRQLLGG